MDDDEINILVQTCKFLKYKFKGVFAADNFPFKIGENSFIIVNVSTAQTVGTHWTLICQRIRRYIFADPLGQSLILHNRLVSSADDIQTVYELFRNQPIQDKNSSICGIFCIYIAH